MTRRSAILLFSCSPEDLGWEEERSSTPGLRQEVGLLHDAIVADLAERLLELTSCRVVVFETGDTCIESATPIPSKVERKTQPPGLLHRRVQECVREIMDGDEPSGVVVFLGRNPLYPMHLLTRGIELLAQEDDVIVLGESLQQNNQPSLMWLAMKSYHPEIFEHNERWWEGGTPLLQAAADVEALVMTVRPVRNIASIDDLGYLFHEIEREVLLKQWHPVRTYEALWRMRRKHLIPETSG